MSRSDFRRSVVERLGRFPERAPLDVEFGAAHDLGDMTRTRVTYQVAPDERIAAWLLQPAGDAPVSGRPGMLAIHQHAGEYYLGKSEPAGLSANRMYHYGVDLCRRGYVVLCPDHLCFEERRPPEYVRMEQHALDGANYERFEFTRHLLQGSSLQTKYLHDLQRALDLLEGLEGVDAGRLGAIGHSLGGQEVLWLTWFDERIKAGVSSCGFSLVSTILRDGINHNFALYVPDLLSVGDVDSIAADIAPRAFCMTAGTDDGIFPLDGVHAIAERATSAYAEAGVPDRFRAIIFSGGHSFPDEVKDEAYAFLDQWVMGAPDSVASS